MWDDKKFASAVNRALSSDYVIEHHLKHFAGGLTVMTNNICNAKCVCCPQPFHTDRKTTLSFEAFKRAIDSAFEAGYVGTMQFTPMAGEPLADPILFDKIAYAQAMGVQAITFSTNGILLGHGENYKKLIDSNIDQIHVSSPGFDPDYYKQIFGVDKCDELIDGLYALAEYKRKRGAASKTIIEVSVMLSRPRNELMELRGWKLLRPYFDDRTLKIASHDSVEEMLDHHDVSKSSSRKNGDIPVEKLTATLRPPGGGGNAVDNYSGSITKEMLPPGWVVKSASHTTSDIPCWRLFEDVAILPDGKVRVCSCRYKGTADDELVIGNTANEPMAEILFGERHKELIRNVASGRWPEVCAACSMYQPASFNQEEVDFLESVAQSHRVNAPQTYPINSSESYRARAEAKLALAAAIEGDPQRAEQHNQSALHYALAFQARNPNDSNAIDLLNRARAPLYETLFAKARAALVEAQESSDIAAKTQALTRAVRFANEVYAAGSTEAIELLIDSYHELALLHARHENAREALAFYRSALAAVETALVQRPSERNLLDRKRKIALSAATTFLKSGEREEADLLSQTAFTIARRLGSGSRTTAV